VFGRYPGENGRLSKARPAPASRCRR
jgi:hypothetical protein